MTEPDRKWSGPEIDRRSFLRHSVVGLGGAWLWGLAGCAPGERVADTLAIGVDRDVATLDPAMHRCRTVQAVVRNMFDGLVTRDPQMRLVPEIAASWRRVDPLTWLFDIRPGIRFHNGDPLTAEDAAFTILRTITPGAVGGMSSPRRGLLGSVNGAEALEPHLLRITTAEPYPILPQMLVFHEIVPRRYIEQVDDEHFARNPVGAGPFAFVQHVRGERIVMERFDAYWGGSPEIPGAGPARLERLVFMPVPEVATRLACLLAGDIDIAEKVPPHAVRLIEQEPQARLSAVTGTRTFFIALNCTRPPFDDVRVRRAVAHGLDIPRMVARILEGRAEVLAGALTPAAFGFDERLEPYPYDPQRARALLAEAGVASGLALELDAEDVDREMAEAAAAQLSEIGLRVRPRIWKWDVLHPLITDQQRSVVLTSWGNATLDPTDIMLPLLVTDARGNYMGYSNPEVDEALEASDRTFDPDQRRALFGRVQRIVREEVPAVFGWAKEEIYGVRRRVRNWEARADSMLMMHRTAVAPPGAEDEPRGGVGT